MKLSPAAGVKVEVTQVATTTSDSDSETTGTVVRVTKFDFAYYRHKDLLLRVKQTNDPDISLRNRSDAHIRSLLQPFRACGFDYAKKSNSITTSAMATRSQVCKGDPSSTPSVLDGVAFVVLLNQKHRPQGLRDLQMAGDIAWVEAFL